jgi:tetratricopeptide (TPR) repeat protein
MTPPLNSADSEWIKSRLDRLGSLTPEARTLFLEQVRAERPDLASILESRLNAPTETFHLTPGALAQLAASERRAFTCGEIVAGRYLVRTCVGSGGMGEVYEVEDTHMPERGALALKTVRGDLLGKPEIGARFEREVRHALELAHPNVCRIYDVSRHTAANSPNAGGAARSFDILFLTMEFLSGGTLANWLLDANEKPRAVPQSEALPLIRQMIAGLAAIHGQRIVHRDFKPLNVMLVTSGSATRAVITDLGLARTVRGGNEDTEGDPTLTRTGASPGTPPYMAPELRDCTGQATYASDVYSLGVSILEMLTASRAGIANAANSLKAAGVDARLTAIVLKCLQHDPARRYRDAAEVAAALDPKSTLPKLPVQVAALVLLGVCMAAGGYFWWSSRDPAIPAEALKWFHGGVEDMQSGSYYAGAKKFQEATRIAPDFTMAHVRLAEAWFGLEGHNLANAEMVKAAGQLKEEDQIYREAIRLALSGQYDKAVEVFKNFVAHASDTNAARLSLARAQEWASHGAEARKIYASLTSVYPGANLRLAVLDARAADWKKANLEFDAAIEGFRKSTNEEGETEAIYERGLLNLQAVKLDDARQLLNQLLDRALTTHNVFQQIRAQIDLSTIELRSSHIENAIALAKQAMQSATDQRVEVLYSRANRGLANAYTANGDYDKAEPLLQDLVRLYRENSDDRLEAGALTLLSDAHNRMGRFADAATEAGKALDYYDKQKNPNLIVLAAHAGANAHRDLGQFQAAAELANRALLAAANSKNDGLIGEAQEAIGSVELARQRRTEAASHLRLALDANTRAKAAIGIPNESLQLGSALAASGQYADAYRLFASAAQLAAGRRKFLDGLQIERAEVELYRGNAAAAEKLVSAIRPDDSDTALTARLALISDSAQISSPVERGRALLKLDNPGLPFSLRRRVHFAAATDLFRGHDFAGASAALGPLDDYAEMAEYSWRAPLLAALLASRLNNADTATARSRDASAALAAASPFLGYSISNKTSGLRLDLRDELREMTIMSSGK